MIVKRHIAETQQSSTMIDEMFAFDVPTFVDIAEASSRRATHATLQFGIDRMNIFDAWFTYPHVLHERDNHSAYSFAEKRGSKTKKSKKTFQVAASAHTDGRRAQKPL
jgi:hypothetical protein